MGRISDSPAENFIWPLGLNLSSYLAQDVDIKRARWQLTEIQSFPPSILGLDHDGHGDQQQQQLFEGKCWLVHQFPPMQNYSSRAAVEQLSGMSGNKQEINLLKLP